MRIVPIVPDEARTFGMESLFRQFGIYSSVGQMYEPVDAKMLLYYKEAKDGQILEEGITEAGSMASFTAAGTAYATHGVDMIPFFIFYSMFGFQRIGDLIWAFADMRGRGFLLGATSGVVAAPCGAPAFAVVLTWVAATGAGLMGFVYLFVFSLGMTTLLVVVGLFSGTLAALPRSGMWMVWIKRAAAVIMLAMAEYYFVRAGYNL